MVATVTARVGAALRAAAWTATPTLRARPEPVARRERPASPLDFLAARGLPPGALLAAEAEALRLGIGADEALLAQGAVGERALYQALARSLRAPFVDAALFAPDTPPAAVRAGLARLAGANAQGRPVFAMAPRGAELVALKRLMGRQGGERGDVAIMTPSGFSAALRGQIGARVAREASANLAAPLCAERGLSNPQRVAVAGALALCALALSRMGAAGDLATIVVALFFLVSIVVRLAATASALEATTAPPRRALADRDLPRFSVVLALYKEAEVAADLVAALERIDYPRAKLEVKLVVEEEDETTRRAFEALRLPSRYEIVVAPNGRPRTKPRALNVALPLLRGDLVVVYDAEDRPEPDQLRRAAERFAAAPARVACLQGRLAIDNAADGWIAGLFRIEYAGLFDVLNPGYAALGLPIPLGGTSNHFRVAALREAGGWDAWNVTEDADLGLRLARLGYAVEALDSTTHEEAPFTLRAWSGQRGRWLKGWMQTLAVHTRAPRAAWRDFGAVNALAALGTIAGALASALFLPVFTLRLGWDVATGEIWRFEGPLSFVAATLSLAIMALGPIAAFAPPMLGLWRRRYWRQAPLLALLPVYYLMISFAAWRAIYEMFVRPHAWVKTAHGVSRNRAPMTNPAN